METNTTNAQLRRPGPPGRNGNGEKAKDFSGTMKKLIIYSRRSMPAVIIALLFAVIATILNLLGPDKLSDMTDLITEGIATGIDMDGILEIGVTLIIFYGCGFILNDTQGIIMANVVQRLTRNLRTDISHKINRLPMDYYNHTSTGDVLSRVTNDVDILSQALNQSLRTLISAVVLFVGSLIMMLVTNVIMTLTAIVATIIGFALMMLIMSRSQKYFMRQQKHLGEINGHVEEIYTGHTVVKAYNGEEAAEQTFETMNENLRDSAFKAQTLSGMMMPIMTFIGNFAYVAVCVVGGMLAINGDISFGVIVAFMLYVRFFTQP